MPTGRTLATLPALAVFLCGHASARAAQLDEAGPHGGTAYRLASSPADPSVVVAHMLLKNREDRTESLFRSTDAGRTFADLQAPVSHLARFGFDAVGDLFAIRLYNPGAPLWVSTDAGTTWSTRSVPGGRWSSLLVSEVVPGHLWIADQDIARSTDGGMTWTTFPGVIPPSFSILGAAQDPFDPDRVAFITEEHLAVTTNGGGSWTVKSLPAIDFSSSRPWPAVAVSGDRILFSHLLDELRVSTDQGATWETVPGLGRIDNVVADRDTPGKVWAVGTVDDASVSNDGGLTWAGVPGQLGDHVVHDMVLGPQGPIFGCETVGVLRPVPGADRLGLMVGFLPEAEGSAFGVREVAIDPGDEDHWAVIARGGDAASDSYRYGTLLESFDSGASWSPSEPPQRTRFVAELEKLRELKFDSDGRLLVSGERSTFEGREWPTVHRRTGNSWAQLLPVEMRSVVEDMRLDVSETDSKLLAVAYEAYESLPVKSYFAASADDGVTWTTRRTEGALGTDAHTNIDRVEILDGTISPRIVLHQSDSFEAGEIYYTDDLGATFQSGYEAPEFSPMSLSISRGASRRMVSASHELPTLASTIDGATQWASVSLPSPTVAVAMGAVHPDLLIRVDDGQRLERSDDGGLTWALLATGVQASNLQMDRNDSRCLLLSDYRQAGIRVLTLREVVGEPVCSPANANNTGWPSRITALGTTSVAANDLSLHVERITRDAFGYFLVAPDAGFVPNAGGSFGNLCLSAPLGRYVGAIQNSGPTGTFHLELDLTSIPQPASSVMGVAGDRWFFQAWYRDRMNGITGSNFSDAVQVVLTP